MRPFDIKRQARRLGIAALLFLVLIGVGSLISVPVDGERVGRLIRPTLIGFLGPDVTLDLSASLSILPRPTLQISNLTISKKDKFSIKSQQATVPVSVVTLLSGGLSGSSLTITNPVITLPPSSLPETRQSALALLSGALGAADSLQQTPIDAVAIRSGKIVVAADTQISFVETFDADHSITKAGRIEFDLRLPWKSEAVDVSARVDPVDPKTGSKASSLVI